VALIDDFLQILSHIELINYQGKTVLRVLQLALGFRIEQYPLSNIEEFFLARFYHLPPHLEVSYCRNLT
jgi:hypothetical protein